MASFSFSRILLTCLVVCTLGSDSNGSCAASDENGSVGEGVKPCSDGTLWLQKSSRLSRRHPRPQQFPADRAQSLPRASLLARAKLDTARSASFHKDLDSTVSSKWLDPISDGLETLGDIPEDVGAGIADVGLTVGDYVGNAAVVVGNSIVEAAETTLGALPSEIKDAAGTLGDVALSAGNAVADVGEVVADATVDLAGDALEAAKHSIAQGAILASTVGNEIASKASALGGEIAKVGPLAAGLAKSAWEEMKKFISCFAESFTLCRMLIGDACDCDAGSEVSVSSSGLSLKCVFRTGAEFSNGFGISAGGGFDMGDSSSSGRARLPGTLFSQGPKPAGTELRSRKALKSSKSRAPSGSCESGLELALEGVVQFAPAVSIRLNANGDTEVGIEGLVRASFDALVSAEGSCAMVAERRFPKKPITKMACAPPFCIMVVLQMLAEVELTGIVTGAAQVGASVDFQISGSVLVNTKGHADVDFQTPSIKHQEGFGLAASAYGSARVGMGPVLTVWPMPGVPVVVNPMFNAEVRAQGTLRFSSGLVLAETKTEVTRTSFASNASRANHLEMCGAAALNMYADVDVQGFALPKAFTARLGTGWIKEKITESILSGARALAQLMTGPAACIPGVSTVADLTMDAAVAAAGAITGLVPDLNLDFSTPSMQLLAPAKLYCKEVYRTPGFDSASCATELGCKFAGRPPTPLVAVLPASQVKEQVHSTTSASACFDIPMGDRFIQLGEWRLGAIDDKHFSIAHKDGRTAQIFRDDGTVHAGPRTDFNAWARPIGPPREISFGFQYIQIGKFRVGAVDDDHLSISHVGGWTEQIFRSDGTLHAGGHKTWHTFDRPESAPTAINVGDRFLQLGKFRLGDADGNHFLVTHESGLTIQIYRSDGTTHPGPDTYWTSRISTRRPASWTCKDLAEMAYGTCSGSWAGFGDRFIQLGDWRLAAIDANHFSISHKDGQTPQIWRNDGTVHPGPRTDYNAWGRPLGFPSGIAFGPGFIQIGQFRLGQIDADHLSIAHKDSTAQIFRSDGTLHNGPRTDYTAWTRSTGPPSGITFGDRFLQLGRFRLGDAGAAHFIVTHDGGQTIQKYASIGTQHPGPRTDWTPALNNRYPQWHCGSVQTVLGTCTGIATGDDFLQLGEWRLGAMDGGHFSVSHQDGQTAQVFRGDGILTSGPRTDWGSWDRETKEVGESTRLRFGDRLIQFGNFRLGEVDEAHLSISHSDGQTIQIWRSDGTRHFGPRTDFNLWTTDHRSLGAAFGVTFGDRFVQIGNFRIGDVDGRHFTVTHVDGKTIEIFREDGTTYSGPRTDYTTFGRQLMECKLYES